MDGTLQLIVNIGAAATALAAIIGLPVAFVKLWPLLKRAVTVGSSLEKLPEMALELSALSIGQRAQGETLDGQNQALAALTTEVRTVKQQVQNSHVTNLRDDVDEVIGKIDTFHDKLDDHLKTCPPTTTINVNPGGTA
jgi:hypothetical protein